MGFPDKLELIYLIAKLIYDVMHKSIAGSCQA